MRRAARKRLMLHELDLIDPDPDGTLRSFRAIVGPAVGLTFGLVFWLIFGPAFLIFGLVMWLAFRLAVRRDVRRGRPSDLAPRTRPPIGLRARARRTMRPRNVLVVLVALVLGLLWGPLSGLCLALLAALVCMVETGTEVVLGEPPARFAHAPPGAVLVASRNSGLILGLTSALAVLLASLIVSLAIGSDLSGWLLLIPLSGGLQIGLRNGLGAWLYHHWLRRTLHRQALLPRRLPQFLR